MSLTVCNACANTIINDDDSAMTREQLHALDLNYENLGYPQLTYLADIQPDYDTTCDLCGMDIPTIELGIIVTKPDGRFDHLA
jgi:hypothetical protein